MDGAMGSAKGGRSWGRRVIPVLVGLVCAYVLWCAMMYFSQDRLLFPRHFAGPATQGLPSDPAIEQLWIEPEPGVRVEAWLVPAVGASDEPRPLVVFFHGNGELIEHALGVAGVYRRLGANVLLPEYRGYGRSGGHPSEQAIAEDAKRFLEMAIARGGVDPRRIIYHGRSLGGGVACALAARRLPAAMVLESTFVSVASIARKYLVPLFLLKNPFHNDRVLRTFDGPVLIMHGRQDGIVPVSNGRRLHAMARNSAYVEIDAGHNNFPPDWNWYERTIDEFLGAQALADGVTPARAASETAGP